MIGRMNKTIFIIFTLLITNTISDNINKSKVNVINPSFAIMIKKNRNSIKMKKNLTNDDYVIKHTYNNTRLRKKKVSTKVQEYLSQIKENNNKIDNIIYNTYLKTKNKHIKNMYMRHKNRYKEKEL